MQSTIEKIIMFVGSNNEEEDTEMADEKVRVLYPTGQKRRRLRADVAPIVVGGEQYQLRQQVQVSSVIEVHSSTQEQTPSDLGQKGVVMYPSRETGTRTFRIPFSIWKEQVCVENLLRLSHIRMSIPKIYKPYCEQSCFMVKDAGKKMTLTR